MQQPVHDQPGDVADRLARLGLTAEEIREAVRLGDEARQSCTDNDPASAPGLLGWIRTVRGVRDVLGAKGWSKRYEEGIELAISPDGSVAIAVATGDQGTGRSEGSPKTKNPKGPAMVAVMSRSQAWLPTMAPPKASPPARPRSTWFLLIARDSRQVRCELSLPSSIGADWRVEEWIERILLEPVPVSEEAERSPVDEEPDIEVDVSRRSR